MEVILIDRDKLKIMLTAPDMQRYALDTSRLESMACTDLHTREAFRHIFHDAEAKTGFHTEGEKILVQMYTSKCGGCEIFVTKLICEDGKDIAADLTPEESNLIRRVLPDRESHAPSETKEATVLQHLQSSGKSESMSQHRYKALRNILLSVDDMETLLSVCHRLMSVGYRNSSRAYIDREQTPPTYHLCLEVPDELFYTLDESFAFLEEYGHVTSHRHASLVLDEYGDMICEKDAVSVLGNLSRV